MRALVIGDYFAPSEMLRQTLDSLPEYVDNVCLADWSSENRGEARKKIRRLETNGIASEELPAGLADLAEQAEIIVVHNCPIPKRIIDSARGLRVIGTIRSGVDNIDIAAATERGIPVLCTPDHNSVCTAEYAIGLMLSETRNIARSHQALKTGLWREVYPNSKNIPELREATVGIIGFGHVGRLVARLANAFGARIIVHDPWVEPREISDLGYEGMELADLLSTADIVTLHARLTPETKGLIGQPQIELMKPNSYLVNTARAGLVDMNALEEALRLNRIAGAAIDVFETEPLTGTEPLLGLDNITVSSHRAGDTRNAYWGAPKLLGQRLRDCLAGRQVDFVANPEIRLDGKRGAT